MREGNGRNLKIRAWGS